MVDWFNRYVISNEVRGEIFYDMPRGYTEPKCMMAIQGEEDFSACGESK